MQKHYMYLVDLNVRMFIREIVEQNKNRKETKKENLQQKKNNKNVCFRSGADKVAATTYENMNREKQITLSLRCTNLNIQ